MAPTLRHRTQQEALPEAEGEGREGVGGGADEERRASPVHMEKTSAGEGAWRYGFFSHQNSVVDYLMEGVPPDDVPDGAYMI